MTSSKHEANKVIDYLDAKTKEKPKFSYIDALAEIYRDSRHPASIRAKIRELLE